MTKMMIYIQPSIYGDSALSHAVNAYMVAIEHDLGWLVNKSRLDEYDDWRSIRERLMSDDYEGILLVGDNINYPFSSIHNNQFGPALAPFYSDKEPFLVDGKVAIRANYYKADRAVSILRGDKTRIINAFNKFCQRKVARYKNVRIFSDCDKRCTKEHYNIPLEYNYKYCKCGSQNELDTILTESLALLVARGHGNTTCVYPGKDSVVGTGQLKAVKAQILVITGCFTDGWRITGGAFLGQLVLTNPNLHFYLGGGGGIPCTNITSSVLPQMLRGRTFVDAFIGLNIDTFFVPYGDLGFYLSEDEPSPPPPPPAKSYIECTSTPGGAKIWVKKY